MARWLKVNAKEGAMYARTWKNTDAGKAYRKKHNEYMKEWRAKNQEKYRETKRKCLHRIKTEVLTHYSNSDHPKCVCCGETTLEFLTIDHKNNNGADHRRESATIKAGGSAFYYLLKKQDYPEGYQTLCMNCQFGKRINNGICPHQRMQVAKSA